MYTGVYLLFVAELYTFHVSGVDIYVKIQNCTCLGVGFNCRLIRYILEVVKYNMSCV